MGEYTYRTWRAPQVERNTAVKRIAGRILLGGCIAAAAGCNGLLPQDAQPTTVTVTFVNDIADSGASISFFSNGDASVSSDDLTNATVSEHLAFSLDANASFQFVRACTDFQAAIVDQASLIVDSGVGATASTSTLVDGMDFACGNFITFRLASQGPDEIQIEVSIGDSNPRSPATNAAKTTKHAESQTTGKRAMSATSEAENKNVTATVTTDTENAKGATNSNGSID